MNPTTVPRKMPRLVEARKKTCTTDRERPENCRCECAPDEREDCEAAAIIYCPNSDPRCDCRYCIQLPRSKRLPPMTHSKNDNNKNQ